MVVGLTSNDQLKPAKKPIKKSHTKDLIDPTKWFIGEYTTFYERN